MSNLIAVSDINTPELSVYTQLTDHQLRNKLEPMQGIFIAETEKVIKVALKEGYVPLSLLMDERHRDGLGKELISLMGDTPVYLSSREILSQISGYSVTRGFLCAMKRPSLPAAETICRQAHRIAVLDGIVDSTNIGAIFRSAAALHIDGILLTSTCCDPFCRRAMRVSMGTICQIPWTRIPWQWPYEGLQVLREWGFQTAAMALDENSVSVENPALKEIPQLAILLGAEGSGLAKETIAHCDYTVMIPMSHGVDSLNVAAASAVAFWEMRYRK